MRPASVLYIKYFCDNWMHRCRRVQISQMPADICCICPAKALLNHIHVENVDLTEIHAAQRESAYCLVAIRFSSTLIVNLL